MGELSRIGIAVCCALVGLSGSAGAMSVDCAQDTDNAMRCVYTYDPKDVLLDAESAVKSMDWTYDTGIDGWLVADGLIRFSLANDLNDAQGKDSQDKAEIFFDGVLQSISNANLDSAVWRKGLALDDAMFSDGLLTVAVVAGKGDFWFKSAQLTVNYLAAANTPTDSAAPVPEAGTILLFGAGLAGLAAAGRRKLS